MSSTAVTPRAAPAAAEAVGSADALTLPPAWAPPPRPPLPLLAAVVPVAGAVAIWAVTGSVLSLWLAALGPLVAAATLLDGARSARRDRRRSEAAARRARTEVAGEVERRHAAERALRWTHHPDVARLLASVSDIWRRSAPRAVEVVLGAGEIGSDVRVRGGEGEPDSDRLRASATRLAGAPVVVDAQDGIAVAGDDVAATAVVRGLALQICLAHPPGAVQIVGPLSEHPWAENMPHRRATADRSLALVAPGEPVPSGADIVLARVGAGQPPPPGCGVHLRVRGLTSGTVDLPGLTAPIAVESVGAAQSAAIAEWLAARAAVAFGARGGGEVVAFHALDAAGAARDGGLWAVVGMGQHGPVALDLVGDGPHAVVAGVTGSGKSELLITWILALCAAHSTHEVSFLLADFKGGTAFDPLAAIPHVTGVITDLDGAGARRALESLRAEIRWREAALADAGARDIADARVSIPRLVIVVDEFAALLSGQPELHAVFADVAARGRALGMHLILGTQRVAGVVRDALLANCPLRLSLRVTDRADSRAVVGTDAAAEIPGGREGRGVALVRRAADSTPVRVRIALTAPDDIAAVVAAATGAPPRRPWLPELPQLVRPEELTEHVPAGSLLIGLADEPERQRQRAAVLSLRDRGLLVVGGPGSGRTTTLETLAVQAKSVIRVGPQPEAAWDAVVALDLAPPDAGTLLIADDLDALVTRFPAEYAQEFVERLERVVREAGAEGMLVAVSVGRLSGIVTRIAELLPRRLLLAMGSRADHFAAGGEPADFTPDSPPGRGRLDRVAVQVALAPTPVLRSSPTPTWMPQHALTGFVSRRSPAARAALRAWADSGLALIEVEEFAARGHPGRPAVVTGDPDQWQRHWRVLTDVRADHDFVVDASCGADLRMLTGSRSLPPYAEAGRGRAWLMSAGADPVRVVLPGERG